MKIVTITILLITAVHLSSAFLHNYRFESKNTKYCKKEPPLRQIKPQAEFDNVYEGWISQRLNNFDPQNIQSFNMRYLFNIENFQPGAPIFIFVGGEWTITPDMLQYGHMYDMAKALNGSMFYTQHRYYGASIPTPDLAMNSLRYLSADQAIADLAHFITYVKKIFPGAQNSGVILVGCSYSAMLVTWFQQKYPHMANGVWALSGPINAKVDFYEYFEVVSKAIHEVGGDKCSERIRNAFKQMEDMVAHENTTVLDKVFRLCHPLDPSKKLDIWNFFIDIANPWAYFVQFYSRITRDIEFPCEHLESIQGGSDAEAYGQWIADVFQLNETICFDHTYEGFMDSWSGTSWDDFVALIEMRQWMYQTCSAIGMYQTSNSEKNIFGSKMSLDISIQVCNDLFEGIFPARKIFDNIDRTNIVFGGRNPNVRFVYSTHGEYDPWAPMGVNKDINDDSPVVILPGESHCSDMSSISDYDTQEMRGSKERIFSLVKQWLDIDGDIKLDN